MGARARIRRAGILLILALASSCLSRDASWLGPPEAVAPGVELFRSTDSTLLDPAAPVAIYLLRLDPDTVRLESALSNEAVVEAERVDAIAARHHALAAVNAGFFNIRNGEPAGVLKIGGELVSDSALTRGIVAISSSGGRRQRLDFDQASVRMHVTIGAGESAVDVPIDGVDTTRERNKLMLYTPSYHTDTDTAARGVEWVLSGTPLQVVEVRKDAGRTPIPRDGAVLSFGGLTPPGPLASLVPGTTVTFGATWRTANGLDSARLDQAADIVNGAGLLRRGGRALDNWLATENLQPGTFTGVRHPRTMIGVDRRGFIWLAAIDGRQPEYSMGMTFAELQRLCDRLELRDALNLDGGGSTTMVVNGQIVNRPSDAAGPRAVSDAIVVKAR